MVLTVAHGAEGGRGRPIAWRLMARCHAASLILDGRPVGRQSHDLLHTRPAPADGPGSRRPRRRLIARTETPPGPTKMPNSRCNGTFRADDGAQRVCRVPTAPGLGPLRTDLEDLGHAPHPKLSRSRPLTPKCGVLRSSDPGCGTGAQSVATRPGMRTGPINWTCHPHTGSRHGTRARPASVTGTGPATEHTGPSLTMPRKHQVTALIKIGSGTAALTRSAEGMAQPRQRPDPATTE